MSVIVIILWIIIGYLFGSIPWALIIGKTFFKKDIRNYGSGNLGGTNAGRVLGKPIGALVIVLDALKAFIAMSICKAIAPSAVAYCGFAASIGHCYPVFAQFKGGKAVATAFGYLLGVGLFVTGDVVFSFVYPILFFFMMLCLFKYVSLASMTALLFEALIGFLTYRNKAQAILVLLLALFVIFRHRTNIYRIITGKEGKVTFIK